MKFLRRGYLHIMLLSFKKIMTRYVAKRKIALGEAKQRDKNFIGKDEAAILKKSAKIDESDILLRHFHPLNKNVLLFPKSKSQKLQLRQAKHICGVIFPSIVIYRS